MNPFVIVESRGFDALKYDFIFGKWYNYSEQLYYTRAQLKIITQTTQKLNARSLNLVINTVIKLKLQSLLTYHII